MNLADALSFHARVEPGRTAVRSEKATFSYRELDGAVEAGALRLRALGIRPGQVVGVCLQDELEHLVAIFAVFRAGAVLLPMDWRWSLAEQSKIARQFRARFVLADPARPSPEDLPIVLVDGSWLETAVRGPTKWPAHPHAPALLSLSSGTTGQPKGVASTHALYRARLESYFGNCGLGAADHFFSVLPLAYAAGRMFAVGYILVGGSLTLFPALSTPGEIAEALASSGADTACLVPSLARAMLQLPDEAMPLFPKLRCLMSIGAPLSIADRQAIRARLSPNLLDIYGASGGGLASVIGPREQDAHAGSVGRPAAGITLEIVDEAGAALPTGIVGRVRYRGPGTPSPEADEELRDGWYYPGDYGAIDADGYLHLHGRRSEIVIRGGINIFTPEVENVLTGHPEVLEAAVIGVPSSTLGEDLVAFLRCRAPVPNRELLDHCRRSLAAYKIPRQFLLVETLPKNSAGKVLKRKLAESAGLEAMPGGDAA